MSKSGNNKDFGGFKGINLATGTTSSDAATKGQLDSALATLQAAMEGRSPKEDVLLVLTTNVTVSNPGTSTFQSVNVSGEANKRICLAGQTSQTENGIYDFNGSSSAMTRASDSNTATDLEGAFFVCIAGDNAGKSYYQTARNITVGTTNIAFTSVGGAVSSADLYSTNVVNVTCTADGTDTINVAHNFGIASGDVSKVLYRVFSLTDNVEITDLTISNQATNDFDLTFGSNQTNGSEFIVQVTKL